MTNTTIMPIDIDISNVEKLMEIYYWSFLTVAGFIVAYLLVKGIEGIREIRRKGD